MKDQPKNQILIYEGADGKSHIEVRFEGETVWLSQSQLAELFGSSKANISEHIKNIYTEGELSQEATVRDFRTVQKEGNRKVSRNIEHYNLDLIISLGYRITSDIATKFRIWATARLKEYIIKGFVLDDERLKGKAGGDYWRELLDRIRDIRSSEKVLYRQVLDLYATSIDYDAKSKESILFFKTVQNKLHYATNQQTAAELIFTRADAEKEFMGLTNFSGSLPVKSEISVAKNYLTKDELYRLNRLVSAFFDLAEIKAQDQEPMKMSDWIQELDKFSEIYGKGKLAHAGKISHEKAVEKAEKEYRIYQARTLSPVEKDYFDAIKRLGKEVAKKVKSKNKK